MNDPFVCSICKAGAARIENERIGTAWLRSIASTASQFFSTFATSDHARRLRREAQEEAPHRSLPSLAFAMRPGRGHDRVQEVLASSDENEDAICCTPLICRKALILLHCAVMSLIVLYILGYEFLLIPFAGRTRMSWSTFAVGCIFAVQYILAMAVYSQYRARQELLEHVVRAQSLNDS